VADKLWENDVITWGGGQVRGPRAIPVVFDGQPFLAAQKLAAPAGRCSRTAKSMARSTNIAAISER